jgi:8-oxo-dGTP diphosphatase
MLAYMSEYLTTGQAAKALGLNITTLQQWAKEGLVTPAFTTPGGRMRWTVDGLLAQLGGGHGGIAETVVPAVPAQPPVVLAVITSRDGVAIGKRTEPPPPWSFIGGAEIEDGESATDTAIRAAMEDARLAVKTGARISQRVHPATGRLVTYIACTPAGRSHDISVGDEFRFTEVKWASLSEATRLMPDMAPEVRSHLQRVVKRR